MGYKYMLGQLASSPMRIEQLREEEHKIIRDHMGFDELFKKTKPKDTPTIVFIRLNNEGVANIGEIKIYDQAAMNFRYRHSQMQEEGGIVLSSRFALKKGKPLEIKAQMVDLTELRQAKQPLEYPSCGSVFKRPEGHFTGKLIQDAGLQGYTIGGAQISMKHAGFIVNINEATATDYVRLITYIQEVIQEKFHVALEPEVRIIGEE